MARMLAFGDGGRLQSMDRVEEIEAAIDHLPPDEFKRLTHWLLERQQKLWDEQMDRDSESGRLDFLFAEAEEEAREGLLRDWPPAR